MNIEATVCIIDYDPILVYGTKLLLNYNHSFCDTLMVHEDCKEALDSLTTMMKCGEQLPDIIFLDLNMPSFSSWQFLEALSALPLAQKPAVYIVGASISMQDMERAYRYTIVKDFIMKPLTDDLLINLFKNIETKVAA